MPLIPWILAAFLGGGATGLAAGGAINNVVKLAAIGGGLYFLYTRAK